MRRIDVLKGRATQLGIPTLEVKKFGSLSKTSTWEAAIAAHTPIPPKQLAGVNRLQLPPGRIICPSCLGKHSSICYRCEGSGQIFNLVRFRAGYIGTATLPAGCL